MAIDIKKPVYVLLFTGGFAAVLTAAVMSLQVASAEAVRRNEEFMQRRGIVEVLFADPDADGIPRPVGQMSRREILDLYARRVRAETLARGTPQEMRVFVAYSHDLASGAAALTRSRSPEVIGYAFQVSGVGFWARITGYLAVTGDLERVKGIAFVQHAETPGLGGEIARAAFRDQFRPDRGLKATAPPPGGQYLYVGGPEASGPTDVRFGRRVDAVTGATGTSNAVQAILNESMARFRQAAARHGLGKE